MKLSIVLISPLLALGIVASLCACKPTPGPGSSAVKDTLSALFHPFETLKLNEFNRMAKKAPGDASLDRVKFRQLQKDDIKLPTLPKFREMGMFKRIKILKRIEEDCCAYDLDFGGSVQEMLDHFEEVYSREANRRDLKRLENIADKANRKLRALEKEWKVVAAFGPHGEDMPPTVQSEEVYRAFLTARDSVSTQLINLRRQVTTLLEKDIPRFDKLVPKSANKVYVEEVYAA